MRSQQHLPGAEQRAKGTVTGLAGSGFDALPRIDRYRDTHDLELYAERTGHVNVARISGSIGLKAFAGVKAEASVRATEIATSTAYEGKIEGKIGVEGFLGVIAPEGIVQATILTPERRARSPTSSADMRASIFFSSVCFSV